MKKLIWKKVSMAAVLLMATVLFLLSSSTVLAAEAAAGPEITLQKAADFEVVVLKSEVPCIVDFYADWCPPCKRMMPVMEKLAKTWQGKIKVVKVNVDKFGDLSQQYGVEGIPDVRIFSGGKQTAKYVGFQDEKAWTEIITKLLAQ